MNIDLTGMPACMCNGNVCGVVDGELCHLDGPDHHECHYAEGSGGHGAEGAAFPRLLRLCIFGHPSGFLALPLALTLELKLALMFAIPMNHLVSYVLLLL